MKVNHHERGVASYGQEPFEKRSQHDGIVRATPTATDKNTQQRNQLGGDVDFELADREMYPQPQHGSVGRLLVVAVRHIHVIVRPRHHQAGISVEFHSGRVRA